MATERAYEDGVGERIRWAPETGKLHLGENETSFGEVSNAAERVD